MGSEFVLIVSAAIFCIGAVGFLIRRNPLIMLMSVELMLNSVNFLLIAYSSFRQRSWWGWRSFLLYFGHGTISTSITLTY